MAIVWTGCKQFAASLESENGMKVCLQHGQETFTSQASQEDRSLKRPEKRKSHSFRGGRQAADRLMREFSRL